MSLTPRQKDTLDYIVDFEEEYGFSGFGVIFLFRLNPTSHLPLYLVTTFGVGRLK